MVVSRLVRSTKPISLLQTVNYTGRGLIHPDSEGKWDRLLWPLNNPHIGTKNRRSGVKSDESRERGARVESAGCGSNP